MATNKYEAFCATCAHLVKPGEGVLMRGRTGWLTYCPEHAPDRSQAGPELGARTHEHRRHDPLAAFLHARLDEDKEGSSGDGTSWRHHPARSGTVIDDHDVEVVQTWRHVADHLQTWHPNRAWANINSRRLVVNLFEVAPAGSESRAALGEAVRALAMTYQGHPDYDPAWTLREL
ncbi:DUF6221 family protein [Kitasatospora sp. NPDC094011]|uniref:DUF6221 family protein n=1 Tax=Kitasatospora sp. NPDC094011 TaxID=3364090 RepID=UPI00381B8FC1